jgi:hypothetical protein
MTLPSNVRSLFAFGVFCAVAGAWLTLVTEARTAHLTSDTDVIFVEAANTKTLPPCRTTAPIEDGNCR